jgi:hypothetical protein
VIPFAALPRHIWFTPKAAEILQRRELPARPLSAKT